MFVARSMLAVASILATAMPLGEVLAHGPGRHGHDAAEPARPRAAKERQARPRREARPRARPVRRADARVGHAGHDHARPHGHAHGAGHLHPGREGHGAGHAHGEGGHARGGHAHGTHSEHIFGFLEGADLHRPGETDLKFDNIGGFHRRRGIYHAVGSKLEVHTGVVDGVNAAIGFLGDYHRVRSVPGLEDVPARAAFSGASAELRLGLIRREEAGVGVTLRIEPSVSRFDELSGLRASSYGAENALLVDTELVPGTLFAAMNLFYDLERTRERGALTTERGSGAGIGGALAYQVMPGLFVGGEARYLRAYEGLGLNRFGGDALLIGPTLHAALTPRLSVTAALSAKVAGRDVESGGAAEGGEEAEARTSGNVVKFERYQARLKLIYSF